MLDRLLSIIISCGLVYGLLSLFELARKKKCAACGGRFKLAKDCVYVVEERRTLVEALSNSARRFDAMDCPKCGCQNALAIRMPEVKDTVQHIERDTPKDNESEVEGK